jgi:hypothetical protein
MSPTSVERVRHRHIITYFHNNREYKIIYKHSKKRGVPVEVFGDDDTDITSKILPFFGPFNDFHGSKVTPHDLGYKGLKVKLLKGETKEFEENDVIEI